MKPNPKPHPQPKRRSCPERPPELDVIAIDIAQRLVAGKEPWIRPSFHGLSVPALDLIQALEFALERLQVWDPRTAKELRKTFSELADSNGLILLPPEEAA